MDWERFAGSTLRATDAAHEVAYAEALEEYEFQTGNRADASWRALLYIGTADVAMWDWLQPRIDYSKDRVDLHTDVPVFGNLYLRVLLDLARHLHRDDEGPWQIDLASMLDSLPGRYYHMLLGAIREYRES